MSEMGLLYTMLVTLLVVGSIIVGGMIHIILLARGWTLPGQDAKLNALTQHLRVVERQARQAEDSARTAHDSIHDTTRAVMEQFGEVNSRLDQLLSLKETVRTIQDRLDQQEQDTEILKVQIDSLARGGA